MFNMTEMLEKAKEESSRVEKIASDRHEDITNYLDCIEEQIRTNRIVLNNILNLLAKWDKEGRGF